MVTHTRVRQESTEKFRQRKSLIGVGTRVEIDIEIVAGGYLRVTIVEVKDISLRIVHSGDDYTEPQH